MTTLTFEVGDTVQTESMAGLEFGKVVSINHFSGRVDVWFDYDSCPHFYSFNFNQIKKVIKGAK